MLTQAYPNKFQYWPSSHFRSSGGGLIPISPALVAPSLIRHYKTSKMNSDSDVAENWNKKQVAKPSVATMFLSYNNVLYANFIDNNELVILEQPWRFVVPTLPDSLERKVYGT
jgi:hypothetical protein